MVLLAVGVVVKAGRPLVARTYTPNLSKARLESLLISFPRAIQVGTQHNTALSPDGSIRYVWAPVDELYVVLLTPPISNILQDIDTLHLLGRIVTEMCSVGSIRGGVGESEVLRNAFELLSSFDEVISLGYRERVGMTEVRAAMEMESHEERIQEIIARNKEQEAKEELKRRAKQLEMQRREALKRGQNPYGPSGGMGSSSFASSQTPYIPPTPVAPQPLGDRYSSAAVSSNKPFKTKGMQLGGKGAKKQADLLESLGGGPVPDDEDVRRPLMAQQASSFSAAAPVSAPVQAAPAAPAKPENPFGPVDEEEVHLAIREKLSLSLNRDGGLEALELKGDLDLRIASADVAKVVLQLSTSSAFNAQDLQFKTHPRIDKKAWSDSKRIQLRDPQKQGFPVNQGLAVLKWRLTSKDESVVPLNITCWPSPTDDGNMEVNIEYELVSEDPSIELRDLVISIPCPSSPSSVTPADGTSYEFDPTSNALQWHIEHIDPTNDPDSKNRVLEFTLPAEDADDFFPLSVEFVAQRSLAGVVVDSVADISGGSVPFSQETLLNTEEYAVV